MILALGFLMLLAAFAVLLGTFYSIANLAARDVATGDVQWLRLLKIYLWGARYFTGQPIRARFGSALILSTLSLYPVSFLLYQEFNSGLQDPIYLILSRSVNVLGQLCAWPSWTFLVDSTTVSIEEDAYRRALTFFVGTLFAILLIALHPTAFFGLWPWKLL